jgi:glycosyltransferase involved in cell wall biosynthesis
MEQQLRQMVKEQQLEQYVHLLGAMKPEQVRSHMERAGIFLFTSDKQEGWGAVLNESMNSACAVVASHAIGAVPYLIKNKENGIIYRSGHVAGMVETVKDLLDSPQEQAALGQKAYETITGLWNAEVAAQRVMELSAHILAGEKYPDLYESGPCSRAKIITDDWM